RPTTDTVSAANPRRPDGATREGHDHDYAQDYPSPRPAARPDRAGGDRDGVEPGGRRRQLVFARHLLPVAAPVRALLRRESVLRALSPGLLSVLWRLELQFPEPQLRPSRQWRSP